MTFIWFAVLLFLWVIAVHLSTMPPLVIVLVSFTFGAVFAHRLRDR